MFGVFGCASFVIGVGFFSATYVRHNLSLHTCTFWSTYLYLLFMMLRPFIDCGTTFHGTSSLGSISQCLPDNNLRLLLFSSLVLPLVFLNCLRSFCQLFSKLADS